MNKTKHQKVDSKREVVRISGSLKEILTVRDEKGNVLHRAIKPLMLEFRAHDMVQVIVGSLLLATPIGLTEEVWRLSEKLPITNLLILLGISLVFIATFVYHNFYRRHFKWHETEFIKRILAIYIISFAVVGVFLTLIQQAPWSTDLESSQLKEQFS